ncbi:sugar-binding domain-containing protein [Longitalea luteola]|uniref:sugar-binding domain-containing protein n=1 Tax=Longitalea luteola TaxID=2812563 RepID=UPI001A97BAAE|nr:sugar-binding domain-containing protein [Longitalea luteola]
MFTFQLYRQTFLFIYLAIAGVQALAQEPSTRENLSLAGTWTFRLDSMNVGLAQHWQDSLFKEVLRLPGTLEENKQGVYVTQPVTQYLNQTYKYTGPAWYKKEIEIPESWKHKQVALFLERTKATQVWIDGKWIGRASILSAPHVYDLTGNLSPGKHTITILVNNTPALFPVGGSHALSEHTQTNWNGIIGRMYLEAAGALKINWIKITPDVKNKEALVQIRLQGANAAHKKLWLQLQATAWNTSLKHAAAPRSFPIAVNSGDTILSFRYPLGPRALLWNEYSPALYRLTATLRSDNHTLDKLMTNFGLRSFKPVGTQFRINDVVTFLRGKNESCVFPLTGYPPTDMAHWRKLYRTAKQYGINHFRFHSYTPPAAAFEAADVEGIYIQAELPNWADLTGKDTTQIAFQYQEGCAILDAFGNHPSFVMCTLGNELAGNNTIHEKLVADLRNYDGRRLYAYGTNAFYNDPAPGKTDDFWVTMRTGKESAARTFDVRGSFAATEDTGNGIINSVLPSTLRNFSAAIRGVQLPVIGHETGQYQIYPDYKEMACYTGVLRPLNFKIFRERLQAAGMGDQADSFCKASGMLTALLYREEIEMAFRTPGFGGFQLLDLQDFPGQGTALVGLLNAFMENKGFVAPAEFRRFNNDVVVQLLMEKYTWANNETFAADMQVVNYSPQDMKGKTLRWSVVTANDSRVLTSGKMPMALIEKGKINPSGKIVFPLNKILKAAKLEVRLEIENTPYRSAYPVWVYPDNASVVVPAGVTIATQLDDQLIEKLNKGARVLLFPDHKAVEQKTVGPQFISEFWNWLVFKGVTERSNRKVSAGTLGILTKPDHPLFRDFPTEFHSNWQWWSITKNARPLILDSTNRSFRPIVQVIDNIDRNHKLGMIFECKAGKGRLLVCMANLPALLHRPEARCLYHSMLRYVYSGLFDPKDQIEDIEFLLR